jgi:hypothetical protein
MLSPTIKLIPELELALIQGLTRNRWWYHTTSIDTTNIISYEAEALTTYLIENKTHDFITNLCRDNIRKYYASWLWMYLCCNPSAIEILLMFQDKIKYSILATNTHPDAVGLFEKKEDILYGVYCHLCSNPSAVYLIKKYPKLINMYYLSLNPNPAIVDMVLHDEQTKRHNIWDTCFLQNRNSIEPFFQYLGVDVRQLLHTSDDSYIQRLKETVHEKSFSWKYLSSNPHPSAIKMMRLFPENVHREIVENTGEDAYDLICMYIKENASKDVRVLRSMCANTNPRVLELLGGYPPEAYDWGALSKNPSAIPILMKEENRNRIQPLFLLQNPNIFVYNYDNIRKNTEVFKEELLERVWSPSNVVKWLKGGYDDFLEYKGWW